MARILVLGVAAVQDDFIRHAKSRGHFVIACAGAADGPGAQNADVFVSQDFSNIDAIVALAEQHAIDVIYSVGSDRAMPVVGAVSERLGLPVLASAEVARICNDKLLMRDRLGAGTPGNVPFFRVYTGESTMPNLSLPFIVKPNDSQGQRGVALVTVAEEYPAAVAEAVVHSRNGQAIVERYLDGPEISVNGYLTDGELVFCAISDRGTWEGYIGLVKDHRFPSQHTGDSTEESVKALLSTLARSVGLENGPVYAQMKLVEGVPYVLEVSPRLDGCHLWRAIDTASGINLLDLVLTHLVDGVAPSRASFEPRRAVPTVLEFLAQKPGVMTEEFDETRSIFEQLYYSPGDIVRPINGRMDKVGYRIVCDA